MTGGVPEVTITVDGDPVPVAVREVRPVPTISCRSAGGLPTKPAIEYAADIV